MNDLRSDLPGSVMGIDYGSRKIGIAVSDPMRILAQGAGSLPNDGELLGCLQKTIRDRGVTLIVVGMPYSEDGGKGAKAREVDRFIERLREALQIEVETWDESLSSEEARQLLVRTGMRKKQRRQRGRVDEMAARILLQGYLDHRKESGQRN